MDFHAITQLKKTQLLYFFFAAFRPAFLPADFFFAGLAEDGFVAFFFVDFLAAFFEAAFFTVAFLPEAFLVEDLLAFFLDCFAAFFAVFFWLLFELLPKAVAQPSEYLVVEPTLRIDIYPSNLLKQLPERARPPPRFPMLGRRQDAKSD